MHCGCISSKLANHVSSTKEEVLAKTSFVGVVAETYIYAVVYRSLFAADVKLNRASQYSLSKPQPELQEL